MIISCRKNNVAYGLICNNCLKNNKEMVYDGDTSRSASFRLKNMDPKNVISKHKMT